MSGVRAPLRPPELLRALAGVKEMSSYMNRLIFVLAVLPAAFVLAGCSHAGGSGAASTAANVIELAHEPTTTFKVTYRPDLVQVDHASAAQSIVAISPDGSTF